MMSLNTLSVRGLLIALMTMSTTMMPMMMMVTTMIQYTAAGETVNVPGPPETASPNKPTGRSYPLAVSGLWELVKSKPGQAGTPYPTKNPEDATKCSCKKTKLALEQGQREDILRASQLLSQSPLLFEKFLKSGKLASPNQSYYGQNLYSIVSGNQNRGRTANFPKNNGKNRAGHFTDKQVLGYQYGEPNGKRMDVDGAARPDVGKATVLRVKRVRDIDDEFRKMLWILEERRRAMEVQKILDQLIQWRKGSP